MLLRALTRSLCCPVIADVRPSRQRPTGTEPSPLRPDRPRTLPSLVLSELATRTKLLRWLRPPVAGGVRWGWVE